MRPQEIVEVGLELLSGDRGTVLVDRTGVANLRWANSTLTTNGLADSEQVHVAVHPEVPGGLAAGTASAVVSSRGDLVDLVDRARAVARDSGPARDVAPEVPARAPSPGWEDAPARTGPDELAPVAELLGDLLPASEVPMFGYAEHSMTTTYLGTSGGLRLRHDQPSARFEISGKSQDRTRSAWAGRSGRHFADMALRGAADEVDRGLAAQRRRIDVPAGRQQVLLTPSAAADLLIYLYWSAGARDAADGRSAFSRHGGGTRVGEQVSTQPFHLASDPAAPGLQCADHVLTTSSSSISSAFDAGLPLGATDWISQGHLRALVTTRDMAARTGSAPTPAVDNLLSGVAGRTGSLDDLAARVGDGLLVTCLWYIREVDAETLLLTGLTRDGVYVVRDGEIVGATGNYRFNESPLGMLSRISDAGTPVDCLPREFGDWFQRTRVAPLAIEDFNLSTPSEAV